MYLGKLHQINQQGMPRHGLVAVGAHIEITFESNGNAIPADIGDADLRHLGDKYGIVGDVVTECLDVGL